MIWMPLSSAQIFFAITIVATKNVYLNINSLDDVSRKIADPFIMLKRPESFVEWMYHPYDMMGAIKKVSDQMELYQTSIVNFFDDTSLDNEMIFPIWIEYMCRTYELSILDLSQYNKPITMKFQKSFNEFLEVLDRSRSRSGTHIDLIQLNQQMSNSNRCDVETPQPRQYHVFKKEVSFISTNLKEFIIDIIIEHYKYIHGKISRDQMIDNIEEKLRSVRCVWREYHSRMEQWIIHPDRRIANCDVKNPIRDQHFIELEKTFQLIIIPRFGVMNNFSYDGECEKISGKKKFKLCSKIQYCASCEGMIRNCISGPNIDFCTSPEGSSRRYEWITTHKMYSNKRIYGEIKDCPKANHVTSTQFHINSRPSEYCICTCDGNSHYSKKSTSIISSEIVESDIWDNKVITGVRFVKKQGIIYTQIKEGQLKPGGHIRSDGIDSWKPLPSITPDEVNNQLKENKSKKKFVLINNDMKRINLNDLRCPTHNFVLTGVGLGLSQLEANKNRITLFIICCLADLKRGVLNPSIRRGPAEDSKPHMNELKIGGVPPDMIKQEHTPDSSDDQYVEIRMSDNEKDAGQSVLPWFDAQNVMGTESVPLFGIGLYHKGAPKSGGYLAYRLLSIDYSQFVLPEDPYLGTRKYLENAPPTVYCAQQIPRVLCILCNGSYAEMDVNNQEIPYSPTGRRLGIIDECCSPKLCDANDLKKYCGPLSEDNTGLNCDK